MLKKIYPNNCLLFCFGNKFMFSQMPYFKQMAKKLNINLLKINDEIANVQKNQRCLVYGIRQIPLQTFLQQTKLTQPQRKEQQSQELEGKEKKRKIAKQKYFDEQTMLGFVIDKNSSQAVQYDLAKRIAQNLNLDICLMKQKQTQQSQNEQDSSQKLKQSLPIQQQQPKTVLNLTKYRQYIYREYFLKELKRKSKRNYIQHQLKNQSLIDSSDIFKYKGGQKTRIKTLRIGQEVHMNDLNNKKNQINRWLNQGQRTIKIISNNTSQKSQKAIKNFCLMFQKQVEIIQQKIQQDLRKKPILRLYAILNFQEEIEVDLQFINRRWKRRQAQIKLNHSMKNKPKSQFDIDLTYQDPQIQKHYLNAFQQSGLPYPQSHAYLNKFQKQFQKQGIASLVRQVIDETSKIQDVFDEPTPTEEELRRRQRQFKKIMELRTVEDIIEQMEELKSREYQMEQYQSERFKQLQKELKSILSGGQTIKKEKNKFKNR